MAEATVFSADPPAQARGLRAAGLRMAPCRRSRRRLRRQAGERAARSRRSSTPSTCRSSSAAASATSQPSRAGSTKGVARVILGTAAVRDPGAGARGGAPSSRAASRSASTRADGLVAVEGWARNLGNHGARSWPRFEDAGVAAIIYTDIDRDGVLQGLNIEATLALAGALDIPVIASGGLASLADLERLLQPDCAKLERRHHRPRAL